MEEKDMKLPIRRDHCTTEEGTRTSAEVVIAELASKLLEVTRRFNAARKLSDRLEHWAIRHTECWNAVFTEASSALDGNEDVVETLKKINRVAKHNSEMGTTW